MDTKYWHGGQRGLWRGGMIKPPSSTRARNTILDAALEAGLNSPATRDEVYVTTSFDAAVMYAVVHPSKGWVYQVEPIGELREDPDCSKPGLSFACDSARILDTYKPTSKERAVVFAAIGIT